MKTQITHRTFAAALVLTTLGMTFALTSLAQAPIKDPNETLGDFVQNVMIAPENAQTVVLDIADSESDEKIAKENAKILKMMRKYPACGDLDFSSQNAKYSSIDSIRWAISIVEVENSYGKKEYDVEAILHQKVRVRSNDSHEDCIVTFKDPSGNSALSKDRFITTFFARQLFKLSDPRSVCGTYDIYLTSISKTQLRMFDLNPISSSAAAGLRQALNDCQNKPESKKKWFQKK
jgi:hypothetical protein